MSITFYWISPEGDQHPVPTNHIDFIIDNPTLFGLTSADIQTEYEKQVGNSRIPTEDLLIASVQEQGWIRTEYNNKSNYWSIRYSVRRKTIKGIVYDWIMRDEISVSKPNYILIHSNLKPTFVYHREIEKFLTVKNYKIEEHCLNCRHSIWAVGIGQGFFCRNEEKMNQGGDRVLISSAGFTRFIIPNRDYICEFYEKKICSCSLRSKEEK